MLTMINTEMYVTVRQLIRELTGIEISEDKEYLIPARLSGLLNDYHVRSYNELASLVREDRISGLRDRFIDLISTHETTFFRDESIYAALSAQIIPEWMERNQGIPRKLRIWSMACSSGQEPYSVAMLLHHRHPRIFESVEILATDISKISVESARSGIFSPYSIGRGLPEHYRTRYFQLENGSYRISEEIRNAIRFDTFNLTEPVYPEGWDIILCRNVLFYFNNALRKRILEQAKSSLAPDGVLILGSAESVDGFLEHYIIRECGLARYYELKASRVTFPQKR